MRLLKLIPATVTLMMLNCIVFGLSYWSTGTFDEPAWTLGLLKQGAEFNPYTLNGQWYRIFTHMFLHGHLLHLGVNMLALYSAGRDVEPAVGTSKFICLYFLSGVAGALNSLYWGLFSIGVGASGAIFGLFGFSLVLIISHQRKQGASVIPTLVNFGVFLAINVVLAESFHADNAAHFGGLICGAAIGLYSLLTKTNYSKVRIEGAVATVLLILYFSLPRYQVGYYRFFQKVLATEDSTLAVMSNNTASDETFIANYRKALAGWDTALVMLNRERYLPAALHPDTADIRNYIRYQKLEGDFRVKMIANESYIYLDSIQWAQLESQKYTKLDYMLNMERASPDTTAAEPTPRPKLDMTRIWYDSNWVEIPYPPAVYSRIGYRDSLGRWQGALEDYFGNGKIQMKGTFKDDLRDGIFIYYSDHNTYEAAGRYNEDTRIGKWETFHPNGKLESEVYYRDRYFLSSYRDSSGVQMVKNGEGREIHHHANGIVSAEGNYINGYQEGYWYGRHADGRMYFEENYRRGRLINGRSVSLDGRVVVYDESTLYALPEGGYQKLNEHIRQRTSLINSPTKGKVKISFRVTPKRQLTEFKIEESLGKELDDRAKQIIIEGPGWLPARLHGQEPTDGYGIVVIEF